MQYNEAVDTLTNGANLTTVLGFVVAAMVVIILVASAVEAWRKLFGKPSDKRDALEKHCDDAEERFKRGERHIAENHDNIADLKEGQRVICIAVMALLNHELHNGNTGEMTDALNGVNSYLINRK